MTPAETARGLRQLARYLDQPDDAYPLDPPATVPPSPPAEPVAGLPAFTG